MHPHPPQLSAAVFSADPSRMPGMRGKTVLDDLPESVITNEILARLSAEDIVRCRAVRKSWRHDTSTKEFLLAHRLRQSSLPVIKLASAQDEIYDRHLVVFSGAGDGCRPVLALPDPHREDIDDAFLIHAACDGLLVVSFHGHELAMDICNPATRQSAPLPLLPHGLEPKPRSFLDPIVQIGIAGFYLHPTTGEYRLVYWTRDWEEEDAEVYTQAFYVFAVGSEGKPRPIPVPQILQHAVITDQLVCHQNAPTLHRGRLHWELGRQFYPITGIMVFDTIAETFRWVRRPVWIYPWAWTALFEMEDSLAMSGSLDGNIVDIFVMMEDAAEENWTFRSRIDLSPFPQLDPLVRELNIAVLNERELLIELDGAVFHYDNDGKFLGKVGSDEDEDRYTMQLTNYHFLENITPFPFFEQQQEDYMYNDRMMKDEDI